MTIQEVSAEQFAQLFYHYHQALGDNAEIDSWENLPSREKDRIVSATRLALGETATGSEKSDRRYFAKPGEAEWGC